MQAKTLTLRLPEDNQFHRNLKFCSDHLGEKTFSKTIIGAVNVLPVFMKLAAENQGEIDQLNVEIARLKAIIENARLSAAQLCDSVSQSDLISG